MKIACVYDVIHPYVIGGVQKRIWEVAIRLSSRGHDVTVFGMKHWDGESVIWKDGVRLWGICPPKPLFTDGRRSIAGAMSFTRHLLSPLLAERYDVIDAANFPFFPCFAASLHGLVRRSRLVITWHEVWDEYWLEYMGKRGMFGRAVERLTSRLPHHAVAVSDRTRKRLQALGRREVEVIPSGVDLPAIGAAHPSPLRSDIIFVGRMMKEKNVPLLLEALQLLSERNRRLSCLLVGDGPERAALQSQAASRGLQDQVVFLTAIESSEEVFGLMKSSRVLVLPSVREGLGLVVVEANACGLPVVTVRHRYSAASDMVAEGENGFSCDLSAADLTAKLLAVIDRDRPWDESCRRSAGRYDWETIVQSIERAYQAR